MSTDKNNNVYTISHFRADSYEPYSGNFIRKYNKQGDLIWEIFRPATNIVGIATDEDGNSYISGDYAHSFDLGCGQMYFDITDRVGFVAKLDSNGNCLWSKEIIHGRGVHCALDKSGNALYVVAKVGDIFYNPQFGCPSPLNQYFNCIVKYDNDGNCLWLNPILGWANYGIFGIAVNEKYVAITGRFNGVAYFGMDSSAYSIGRPYSPDTTDDNTTIINNTYTALYDLDGSLKWAKITADSAHDQVYGRAITIDDSNYVFVAGDFYDEVSLRADILTRYSIMIFFL